MTQVAVQLVGASVRRVPVTVQIIGPPKTNTAHSTSGELVSDVRSQHTNSIGYLLLDLTPTDELTPARCFYRVTAHVKIPAQWNIYLTDANAPPTGGPYAIGLEQLQVAEPVPPNWVPVATIVDPILVQPILDQYFVDHPIDVAAAVAAALTAAPPALISAQGADYNPAQFREHISAAEAVSTDGRLDSIETWRDGLDTAQSSDPVLRESMVSESAGVITIETP